MLRFCSQTNNTDEEAAFEAQEAMTEVRAAVACLDF